MKSKLFVISILAICSFLMNGLHAQDSKVAKIGNLKSIQSSIQNGEFIFHVEGLNQADVTKNSVFYKDYFSVLYSEKSQDLSIKMIQSDALGRRIILRYFSSLGIQHVETEGKAYLCNDFYEQFLQ